MLHHRDLGAHGNHGVEQCVRCLCGRCSHRKEKVSPSAESATPKYAAARKNSATVNRSVSTQRLGIPAASTATAPDRAVRLQTFIDAGVSQVGRTTLYDPAYGALAYPGGDVPMVRGLCTDVIIRAYRAIGFDLQVAVYQDMRRAFSAYPSSGRSVPDPNIDHRRVKNLLVFFTRAGAAAPKSLDAADYLPGDVVMWDVSALAHTGIVTALFRCPALACTLGHASVALAARSIRRCCSLDPSRARADSRLS